MPYVVTGQVAEEDERAAVVSRALQTVIHPGKGRPGSRRTRDRGLLRDFIDRFDIQNRIAAGGDEYQHRREKILAVHTRSPGDG